MSEYILPMDNWQIYLTIQSTIVYEMVANNVTYNGKYTIICCTAAKLARLAARLSSESQEQL